MFFSTISQDIFYLNLIGSSRHLFIDIPPFFSLFSFEKKVCCFLNNHLNNSTETDERR